MRDLLRRARDARHAPLDQLAASQHGRVLCRPAQRRQRETGRSDRLTSRHYPSLVRLRAWVYLGFIALDMYALVFVMTPSQGGPNHASEIFASVLNFTAFQKGQFGYACAMGVALAIFTILLAALQLRITRRERIEY